MPQAGRGAHNEFLEDKMKDAIVSLFSGVEIQKRQQIVALMSDWKSELSKNVKGNADRDYDPLDYFVYW
jgi:hypothetical protein